MKNSDKKSSTIEIFKARYNTNPEVISFASGRAEIIGNHTDYNNGFALGCAIEQGIYVAVRAREDRRIKICSENFSKGEVFEFSLENNQREPEHLWLNYLKAVCIELEKAGISLSGADISVTSDLPNSGGISSSAAFELALAQALLNSADKQHDLMTLARLCQRAENSELVQSPCGLLDQATVAFGEKGEFVFFDFKPDLSGNISAKLIKAHSTLENYSFVLCVDPTVKRNLGESGYPARRKMCEASLGFLSKILDREISSLREITINDFLNSKQELIKQAGEVLSARVEHIIYENERVLSAVQALKTGDIDTFGKLLSESGASALSLYGLDEGTPELTELMKFAQQGEGVMGARNMGGGFSALVLALVRKEIIQNFKDEINLKYQERHSRDLVFIDFSPAQGMQV